MLYKCAKVILLMVSVDQCSEYLSQGTLYDFHVYYAQLKAQLTIYIYILDLILLFPMLIAGLTSMTPTAMASCCLKHPVVLLGVCVYVRARAHINIRE